MKRLILALIAVSASCGGQRAVTPAGERQAKQIGDTRVEAHGITSDRTAVETLEFPMPPPDYGDVVELAPGHARSSYKAFGVVHDIQVDVEGDLGDLLLADFVLPDDDWEETGLMPEGSTSGPEPVDFVEVVGPAGLGKLTVRIDPPLKRDLASGFVSEIMLVSDDFAALYGTRERRVSSSAGVSEAKNGAVSFTPIRDSFQIGEFHFMRSLNVQEDGLSLSIKPTGETSEATVLGGGASNAGFVHGCSKYLSFQISETFGVVDRCPMGTEVTAESAVVAVDDPLVRTTWVLYTSTSPDPIVTEIVSHGQPPLKTKVYVVNPLD